MVEEFWNDLVKLLMPNLSICPRSTEHNAEEFFWKQLKLDDWGNIQWKLFPNNCRVNSPCNIIPTLEQLLSRCLNIKDKIVYVHALYDLDHVIKTTLDPILDNYIDMPWVDKTWIWNPEAGYVIEDLGSGDITVGIVSKQEGPDGYFIDHKKTSQYKFPFSTAGIDVIGDKQANQLLEKFRATTPFTIWGRVDWDKCTKKIVVGSDITGIIPALEKLTGSPIDPAEQVYLELVDPDIPLIKTGLKNAIENIPHTYNLAFELFVFAEKMAYVIEVDPLRTITVGVV